MVTRMPARVMFIMVQYSSSLERPHKMHYKMVFKLRVVAQVYIKHMYIESCSLKHGLSKGGRLRGITVLTEVSHQ